MNDGIVDAFRHNAWATAELLRFCEALSEEQLQAPATGTYGSILETLNHLVEADVWYLSFFTGSYLTWAWKLEGRASIAQLRESAAAVWEGWPAVLAAPVDAETLLQAFEEPGRQERAGTVLAQAVHHQNAHREQVNMMLTALGIEPPDLDVWVWDWVVVKGNEL
jgi:uncharacterized damage-inducible protein DinB